MESLTLTPVGPWHAAHTVATFALPASISAPCATGATSRRKDIPSAIFMGLLQVVVSGATVYAFVEGVNSSRSRILPHLRDLAVPERKATAIRRLRHARPAGRPAIVTFDTIISNHVTFVSMRLHAFRA